MKNLYIFLISSFIIMTALCVSSCRKEIPEIQQTTNFKLSEKVLSIGPSGGNVSVDIETDVPYQVYFSFPYDWITSELPDSLYNGPIEFRIHSNDKQNGRIAYVVFFAESINRKEILEVRQEPSGSDGKYEREFHLLETYAKPISTSQLLQKIDPFQGTSLFTPYFGNTEEKGYYYICCSIPYKETTTETEYKGFIKTRNELEFSKTIERTCRDDAKFFTVDFSFELPFTDCYDFYNYDISFVESMLVSYIFGADVSIGGNKFQNMEYTITYTLPQTMKYHDRHVNDPSPSNTGVIESGSRDHSFRGELQINNINADISRNNNITVSDKIMVDLKLRIFPATTEQGVKFQDSYDFTFNLAYVGNVESVECKLDVPDTYTFHEDIGFDIYMPSSMTSDESYPLLHDLLFHLRLQDSGYDVHYDRSLSGRFISYKNGEPVKIMPFGEQYGKSPVILPSSPYNLSSNREKLDHIDFTEKEIFATTKYGDVPIVKAHVDDFSELFLNKPDKLVLSDLTLKKDIGKTVTIRPGYTTTFQNKYLKPELESPLAFGDGFKATRTLEINLYKLFLEDMGKIPADFDLIFELENTYPLNVTISENSSYFLSRHQQDKIYPIANQEYFISSISQNTESNTCLIKCSIKDFFFGPEGMLIMIPLTFTADKECEGERIHEDMTLKINKIYLLY